MNKGVKKYKCEGRELKDKMAYNKHILKLRKAGMLKEAREWEVIVEELFESNQNFIEEMKQLELESSKLEIKRLNNIINEEEEKQDEWIAVSTTFFD